ncbi:MAG: O-antigen ligase family protein [Planctomycetota bacterium]|jgi:hypothetical protein
MIEGISPEPRSPVTRIIPALVVLALLAAATILLTSSGWETSSTLAVYAGIAVIVYVLTLFDIRIGLAVTIAAIGMSPEFIAGGVQNLRIEDFLIPVLLFARMASREESRSTLLRGPIMLYLAATVFSATWASATGVLEMRYTFLIAMKFAEYFILLYLVMTIVRTQEEIRFFTYFFILIGAAAAAQGLLGWAGGASNVPTRVAGPQGETPNIFAGYLTMIIALCIGLFLQAGRVRERFFLIAVSLFLFYVALLTYSRTGYVALAGGLFVFGLFKRRQVLIIILLGAVAFAARSSAESDFLKSPLFGNGPGFRPWGWLDNEYFRVLVDLGVIGLAAFLWLLFRLLLMANQGYNLCREGSFERGLCGGFLLGLLCMVIHAWGATSFTSIRTMEGFMVLSGLFVAQFHLLKAEQPAPAAAPAGEEGPKDETAQTLVAPTESG